MKILLTNGYFITLDPKQVQTHAPYPPLATLYAAGCLRKHNFDFKFLDSHFILSEDLHFKITDYKPQILVIYDDGFNYLTKMCLTNMRHEIVKVLQFAKNKGCITIISSSDATDQAKFYLSHGADFVIKGEAELTLIELLHFLKFNSPILNQDELIKINGLIFFDSNKNIVYSSKRVNIKDLDQLPLPAWDLLDFRPYKEIWLKFHKYISINITTTRGCPFHCNWCAKPIYGQKYNVRSPSQVVQEIIWVKQLFSINHIWFSDDIFGLKPGWIADFNTLIAENRLKIKYKIQSRADLLVQDNTIINLSQSGCEEVWIGAESGSQKILNAMDKGITIEQIQQATSLLKRHHIKPCFFIQFGFLGETFDDIEKTLDMIKSLKPYNIGISVSYPLPETKFYEKVKNSMLEQKQNWTDSDDLFMMYKATYAPKFYKILHRYTHATYALSKIFDDFKIKKINLYMLLTLKLIIRYLRFSRLKILLYNAKKIKV